MKQNRKNLLADLKKITTLSLPAHHPIGVSDIHPDSLSKICSVCTKDSRKISKNYWGYRASARKRCAR